MVHLGTIRLHRLYDSVVDNLSARCKLIATLIFAAEVDSQNGDNYCRDNRGDLYRCQAKLVSMFRSFSFFFLEDAKSS